MVDVAHDVLIREEDCGTKEGYEVKKEVRPNVFAARIFGRFAARDVIIQDGKTVMVAAGEIIDEEWQKRLMKQELPEVTIRSPLTCEARYGMCVKCYGWDMGTKRWLKLECRLE